MPKMVSIVAGFLIWTVLIFTVGCDTPASKAPEPSAQVTHTQSLTEAGLKLYWERQIPLIAQERLNGINLLGESVILFSNDGNLYSVDAAIGNDRWAIPVKVTDRDEGVFVPMFFPELHITKSIGNVSEILNPPDMEKIPAIDAVFINTYSRFLIINSETGQVIRDTDFQGFTATSSGVTDGKRYYVGSSSKHLYCINMLPSITQWRKDVGEVTAAVVIHNQQIFVGTTDGMFGCYTVTNPPQKNWSVSLDGGVKTTFFVDDRGAFVTSDAGYINALDQNSGYPLWPALRIKGQLVGKMQIGEQTIFQPTTAGLWAVDLTNGQLRWTIPGGRKVLAIMDEVVYVLTADKNMLLVNEVTGDILFKVSMEPYEFFAENVKVPAIYAGTADGRVSCLRQLSAMRLDYEMFK